MRKPTKTYTNERIAELKGQIQVSEYAKDVQAVLETMKIERSTNYIIQVVTGVFYNEMVWDAVVKVLAKRISAKMTKEKEVEMAFDIAD